MTTKIFLTILTPTPGLPQEIWKSYPPLSLERIYFLNQQEKLFYNQNRVIKPSLSNNLSWIEKYGPVCCATPKNKIKIFITQFTGFHRLLDPLTTHCASYTLLNQQRKTLTHMKLGHT